MKKAKSELRSWGVVIIIAILIAGVIRNLLFAPATVMGRSMMPTLEDQERVMINKWTYKPERFDIVIFHATDKQDFVKRVIGLPGDTIEYKNDTLYVNGKAYEEPYLQKYKQQMGDENPLTEPFTLKETAVGSQTVPEGCVFVLGDNRRNSVDSRIIGAVSIDKIVGSVKVVYWPLKDIRILK